MDLRPRALIQRLTAAMARGGTEPDDQEQPEPTPARPVPAVRGGSGMVDWWNARNAGEDENATPAEPPPDAHDEPDDADDTDDDQSDAEDGVDEPPAKARRQWGVRGSGKKTYSRPKYRSSGQREEKRSLLDAWHGMRPVTRHGLYNATALTLGFLVGVPQFFTAETAYLVHTYGSWTSFYVCIWYGVAVAIWVLDHHTRNWLPLFALVARMPLISLVVGVLLYGSPA